MHAAITMSTLHWCLWRAFCVEMNPCVTLLLALMRQKQEQDLASSSGSTSHALNSGSSDNNDTIWMHAKMALWGQAVGIFLCIVYIAMYAPRESKYWPRHGVNQQQQSKI